MIKLPELVEKLKLGIVEAAKVAGIAFLEQASKDGLDFLKLGLPSLARYLDLLLTKKITEEEFKSLVYGLKDLAEMKALTVAGLTAIQVDKTRNAILQAVTSIASGAIKA